VSLTPFHPLFGQAIDFVERRIQWGDDLLLYCDHLGYVTALPTRWTSLEEVLPSSSVAGIDLTFYEEGYYR
jgi:hypothetical protein